MDISLKQFIGHARTKGMDLSTVRMLLLSTGWKEKDIAQALVEGSLDVPVPMPPDVGGAREAFLHLFSFACLFTSLISLSVLYFQYLNKLFPDAAFPENYYSDSSALTGIRWSLAAVFVTFPLFIWISRILVRDIKQHPERSRSAIRRWLTYITLLVTGLTLVGDVVTLVFYVLEGEITIRFILKVGIVLLLAGVTFLYYLLSLRMPGRLPTIAGMGATKLLQLIAWATVGVAVVWGLFLVGNPGTERDRRFDEVRLSNLQAIQSEIYGQVASTKPIDPANPPTKLEKPLPATLQDASDNAQYQRLTLTDPDTGDAYEYRIIDPTHFELCATFDQERSQQYDISWDHPAGRYCFQFDALHNKQVKPVPVK